MQFLSLIIRRTGISFLFITVCLSNANAQDNSPYSRYGLGDVMNNGNILNRAMGGISAGFGSDRFINQVNPASYSFIGQPLSRIPEYGKLVSFEVGTEFNSRTLVQQTPAGKYTSRNIFFNYMQLGMQLSKKGNWGVNLGVQPLTKESYKIETSRRITNIDSINTVYEGNGGVYQAFLGTGYRIKNLSLGFNTGYTFGRKESTTNLRLINDTVSYYESSSNTKTNFGSLFLNAGVMYNVPLSTGRSLKIGGYYNMQQKMRASEDIERIVYDVDASPGSPIGGTDSIFISNDNKGTVVYPATMGIGFTYEKEDAFLAGIDFTQSSWSKYRYYGRPDLVQNSWMVKSGVQLIPNIKSSNYWSKVNYRAGFYYGTDYIKAAGSSMPVYAFTFGLGLPTTKPTFSKDFKTISPTVINLAIEAGARGNKSVNLRENFIRVALSVSLSDVWFFRRKYD
jgi:hypothetical protein